MSQLLFANRNAEQSQCCVWFLAHYRMYAIEKCDVCHKVDSVHSFCIQGGTSGRNWVKTDSHKFFGGSKMRKLA